MLYDFSILAARRGSMFFSCAPPRPPYLAGADFALLVALDGFLEPEGVSYYQ